MKSIPENLKALLEKIPSGIDSNEYICKFTDTKDVMLLLKPEYNPQSHSLFTVYRYNYTENTVEKQICDISSFCKSHMILQAYWIDSNNLLINLFHTQMEEKNCIYNITSQKITELKLPKKGSLDDYYNGCCIIRTDGYHAGIYEFDVKEMKFILEYEIEAKGNNYNYLDRLGFVSPAKIARMGGSFPDFQISLNQMKNLFEINIEKVD